MVLGKRGLVIQSVKRRSQTGLSMLEVLVGSLIGLITLAVIGAVFVGGLRLASHNSKRLLLIQSLSIAMEQIKRDVRRAGFNDGQGVAVKLSGSLDTIYVDKENRQLGYVYRLLSSAQGTYRNVVFKHHTSSNSSIGNQLKVCEKYSSTPLSITSAALSGWEGNCYNLFDPNQISITSFEVSSEVVSDDQHISVGIVGHLLREPAVSHSAEIRVAGRN